MYTRSAFTPLSPQHTGSSTPSTYSSATNATWATAATSDPASAMSDDLGGRPPWKQARGMRSAQEAGPAARPAKPTPASPGAVSAARSAANHGRLHKRGSSASSVTTPQAAAFPALDPRYPDIISPLAAYQDSQAPPSPSTSIKSKVKIKPLLRKLATNEKVSLDLSRSAAENEGLGIYTSSSSGAGNRGGPDTGSGSRRDHHARTTSGTSQISATTTSSIHRPGAQYVHPMRQTPRPYTPPLSHSYQNSLASSELSTAQIGVTTEETYFQHRSQPQRSPYNSVVSSYAPMPTLKRTPPPLHIRTYSSSRLTSSSQTNLPGTPSSLRYADNFNASDTMPHTARSSFETSSRKRSRANTNTDPAAQIAAVQALRAEFNAREAAKDLKIQKAEERTQQKNVKKREKRDESIRRKSEAHDRKRSKSNPASEKSVPLSMEYSHTVPVPMDIDLEANGPSRPRRVRTATASSATKAVSSQWSLFWFKFRTMWLKLKRSMSRRSQGK